MRRPALIIASLAASTALLLPTAAYAETQTFEGSSASPSQAYNIAWSQAAYAGYVKSQCTFSQSSDGNDFVYTITCTR
jgi:opacity protein-like surface antigen